MGWHRNLQLCSDRQEASLVQDLHAEGLLVLVLVVIDVDQDLLLPHSLARGEAQADGVHLPSSHLQDRGLEEAAGPGQAPSCAHLPPARVALMASTHPASPGLAR